MTANDAGTGPRILVVDDDPDLLELIGMRLTANGYTVTCATSGEEALAHFCAEQPRVVISDLCMDGMDGHALFTRLHARAPTVPVIMLTAHGTIPDAVTATQRGVFGFLTKPFDGQELLARVAEAMAVSPEVGMDPASEDASWRAGIVSSSPVMSELLRQARRAADVDDPVLISGPRGSGKESLARAIHAASHRASQPFVAICCSEFAGVGGSSLLANTLELARGGCLLLDDIEELPPAEQARLLPLTLARPLFSTRISAASPDVRIVATTTQPLDQAIRDGQFRADLFYALGQTLLDVPALADRREDIPLLVATFTAQADTTAHGLSPEAMTAAQEAAWPGNVRQLRSVVERALALAVTPQVPITIFKRLLQEDAAHEAGALDEARRAFERDYLVQLLKTTCGNVTHAARIAQRNRTEFYKLLARHNIDSGRYK